MPLRRGGERGSGSNGGRWALALAAAAVVALAAVSSSSSPFFVVGPAPVRRTPRSSFAAASRSRLLAQKTPAAVVATTSIKESRR